MSDWVKTVEDGNVYHVHEKLGNIMQVNENMFISLMPKVLKLGPFSTLEEAKAALENKKPIDELLENYNTTLRK